MAKKTYIVAFYSRNTGKKLALPEKKFKDYGDAREYAEYMVWAKPMTRFARITESGNDVAYHEVYVKASDKSMDEENAFKYRQSKSGKRFHEYLDPVSSSVQKFYVGPGSYSHDVKPRLYRPLAPINPVKKKAKKRK